MRPLNLWNMTNDVDKLRATIVDDKNSKPITKMTLDEIRASVRRKYYIGKIDEAYDDLNLYTFNRLTENRLSQIYTTYEPGTKQNEQFAYIYTPTGESKISKDWNKDLAVIYKEILDTVAPIYAAIGKTIPENLQNLTYNQLSEFGKKHDQAQPQEKKA